MGLEGGVLGLFKKVQVLSDAERCLRVGVATVAVEPVDTLLLDF